MINGQEKDRYTAMREKLHREYAGVIENADFSTVFPNQRRIKNFAYAEIFNNKMKERTRKNEK